MAPLRRWIAWVWPAIALGGNRSAGSGAVEVVAAGLFRPALVAIAGLLGAPAAAFTQGDSAVAGRSSASPTEPQPPSDPFFTPANGGKILYLLALAALLALMAFTVWREFHVALRPWRHRH